MSDRTYHFIFRHLEKYSSGWRGAPAKGVGRVTGARVQIPLSPLGQWELSETSFQIVFLRPYMILGNVFKRKNKKDEKTSWQSIKYMVLYTSFRKQII